MTMIPRFRIIKTSVLRTWSTLMMVSAVIGYIAHVKICVLLHPEKEPQNSFQFERSIDEIRNSHKTIVISSYPKSGANMISDILANSRPDFFYSVEPLISLGVTKYTKNRTTVCPYFRSTCINSPSALSAVNRIRDLLTCSGNDLFRDTYHPKWDSGGVIFQHFRDCLNDKSFNTALCYKYLEQQCQNARKRVIMVDRISLSVIGSYLKLYDNVTVIHVFRDPRGIVNSFLKADKSIEKHVQKKLQDFASGLCARMTDDLAEGQLLTKLFPKRFKMMLFEDFRLDMATVIRPLFRFLDISPSSQDFKLIESFNVVKKGPSKSPEKNQAVAYRPDVNKPELFDISRTETLPVLLNPFNWRRELNKYSVKITDSVCEKLYSKLGYNTYKSNEDMRNLRGVPSYGEGGIYPF